MTRGRAVVVLQALARSAALRPVRGVFNRVVGSRPRVVRVRSGVARGVRMELDLREEKAYWLGHYEPVVQALIGEYVRPGMVAYDVGGHRGFFSLCAARRGAAVTVFEASGENAARIRRTLELNALPITLVEAAVWDSDAGVSIVPGASSSEFRVVEGGELKTVTLDQVAGDGPLPGFIKIDVEGAELRVLAGARRVVGAGRPVIVCEAHSDAAVSQIGDLLPGYIVTSVGHPWRLLAVPAERR